MKWLEAWTCDMLFAESLMKSELKIVYIESNGVGVSKQEAKSF